MSTNVILVAGTRPEIIKLSKIANDLKVFGSKFFVHGTTFF